MQTRCAMLCHACRQTLNKKKKQKKERRTGHGLMWSYSGHNPTNNKEHIVMHHLCWLSSAHSQRPRSFCWCWNDVSSQWRPLLLDCNSHPSPIINPQTTLALNLFLEVEIQVSWTLHDPTTITWGGKIAQKRVLDRFEHIHSSIRRPLNWNQQRTSVDCALLSTQNQRKTKRKMSIFSNQWQIGKCSETCHCFGVSSSSSFVQIGTATPPNNNATIPYTQCEADII